MSNKNNKRSANFTEGEKTTLINLVYNMKSVLKTKKTDAASNQKKTEVWAKLAEKFNAASGRSPRDASNLRSKYDDLKKNLRKKIGNNKREMYKTGGGPAPTINLSSDEELLLSLIGPSVFGSEDRGGGDKEFTLNAEEIFESIEVLETNNEVFTDDFQNDMSFRPSDAVDILKRPIQKVLAGDEIETGEIKGEVDKSFSTLDSYERPKKRKRNEDKLDDLIDEYGDLKEERKNLLVEQAKYYREKNERENELFKIELEIKKLQKLEQELKLKMLKENNALL